MDVQRAAYPIIYLLLFISVTVVDKEKSVLGFNIDTENVLELNQESDSWFGYSVAMHRRPEKTWVIVGAPRKSVSVDSEVRPGTVYRCGLDINNHSAHCDPFIPEFLIKDDYENSKLLTNKSSQMLGATVSSGYLDQTGSTLLFCAPNLVQLLHKFYIDEVTAKVQTNDSLVKREVTGSCFYTTDDFETFHTWSPVSDKIAHEWDYGRYGVAQLGFSAIVTPNGFLGGAPGVKYSTGQVFTSIYPENIKQGSESPQDYSYLGYSIAAGMQIVAIGEPNGNEMLGNVLAFSFKDPNTRVNLKGRLFGSYFGYSVAVGDVTGDGAEDVLVGAPQYSTKKDGELGQVVIFRQENGGWLSTAILGYDEYTRFGTSLAVLGDINHDGVQDFAVGAPFGTGPGKVYIYHGTRLLQIRKPVQVLIGSAPSFGFSITGTLDLDTNFYTDLVIGAPLADRAFVFRTRPIVDLRTRIKFRKGQSIQLGEKLCGDLDCTEFSTCLSYRGKGVQHRLKVKLTWSLDVSKKISRLKFKDPSKKELRVSLKKGKDFCVDQTVLVLNNITDVHTPFQIDAAVSLIQEENSRNLQPVLNFTSAIKAIGYLYIANDCANRFTCIPDLKLKVVSKELKYIYGSYELIPLMVQISNEAERAFESKLSIQLLPGFTYHSVSALRDGQTAKLDCNPPKDFNEFTLTCLIGNPMPNSEELNVTIWLQPDFRKLESRLYGIGLSLNSSNPENKTTIPDNFEQVTVHIDFHVDLKISGISQPDPHAFYNLSSEHGVRLPGDGVLEELLGPSIFHVYFVYNAGVSPIKETVVTVEIPSKILEWDFLYLVAFKSSPGISCNLDHVNPNRVKVAKETKTALARLDVPVALKQIQDYAQRLQDPEEFSEGLKTFKEPFEDLEDSGTEDPENKRKKREAEQIPLYNKTYFQCRLKDFESRGEAFLAFSFRLITDTFLKMHDGPALISTVAKVEVTENYLGSLSSESKAPSWVESSLELKTLLLPTPINLSLDPPLWIVVTASTGGMTLFIVLILIMWKCGFFKRRRPPTEEELKLTQYAHYIHTVYTRQIEHPEPVVDKKFT